MAAGDRGGGWGPARDGPAGRGAAVLRTWTCWPGRSRWWSTSWPAGCTPPAPRGRLPLVGPGAVLGARGWAGPHARRLARAGALAAEHPSVAAAWAAGIITSDHVDAIARNVGPLEPDELAAVDRGAGRVVGAAVPAGGGRVRGRVIRLLHPPPDPDPDEAGAYESRSVSFAVTSDAVILSGVLPRVEGEAVIAAVEAFAERLRSEADHVPASARRADGLVALVNAAHASGSIPSRGGLPVSRVGHPGLHRPRGSGVDHLPWAHPDRGRGPVHRVRRAGHPDRARHRDTARTPWPSLLAAAGTGRSARRGHADQRRRWSAGRLRHSRSRGAGRHGGGPVRGGADRGPGLAPCWGPGSRWPSGRTARTATPAQRRALAARDRGCIIPGCAIPAEACQTHHVARLGRRREHRPTPNLALLCWAHHRQVDLGMWTIVPTNGRRPGTPTRTRSTTRNPLARQPQRTLDHHPHTPNPLAAVRRSGSDDQVSLSGVRPASSRRAWPGRRRSPAGCPE